MTWCSRSAISRGAVEEHVDVATGGIAHVFPRFERDLVQPHAREPLEER